MDFKKQILLILNLSGNFQLGGVCDEPRIRQQLQQTALQFSTVEQVNININGTPLDQLLSSQGTSTN